MTYLYTVHMVMLLNRAYQKLVFVIAVTGVIVLTRIYIADVDDSGPKSSLENSEKYYVDDDVMVPGKYAWIPHPVKRNPSGPFILTKNNGEAIKYTNYTYYPLTFNSTLIINNPNICKDTENITFLIMVHTAVPNFDRRKALRETWANPNVLQNFQSRILFLVGRMQNNTIQRSLEKESKQFKDIVQGDFIDDYHNLTHKGILGFRWIVSYCENAKLIFKIDDDMFVNIFLVIRELLPIYQAGRRIIACRLLTNEPIKREGKFAVDPDYFPGYERSPLQYCPGPFVLMFRNIVQEMYEAAKTTPFYWVDDLYLFGILPNKINNVSFHFVGNVHNYEINALKCFKEETPCQFMAAYAWTQGVMYKYWDATLVMYKDLVQKYAMGIQ